MGGGLAVVEQLAEGGAGGEATQPAEEEGDAKDPPDEAVVAEEAAEGGHRVS
jgi:hypothetical protein